MTFSVVGRCDRTRAFGVAITSSSPAVASRCAHVRSGVGAAATQNVTDPRLGPALLDALEMGLDAQASVAHVSHAASFVQWRQFSAIGRRGDPAVYSGSHSLGVNGEAHGYSCVAAGNMLASVEVLAACVERFESGYEAELEERLVSALEAGLGAGGEAGPLHSAGLLVVRDVQWAETELRVDWSETPIVDLRTLWTLWAPQRDDYVTRAIAPDHAPGYHVPGDDR